jgi:hypothetical protein
LSFPLSFQTLTDWVSRMDTPVDGPWRDPSKTGAAETLCSNPVFHELLTLMKKKWPMSFPVFLRAYLAKFGFWKWPGLSGRWRKERMLQEYWDVEFLYQFEELNWSDDRLKRFFDWTDYPKNGLFLFLNERIGYGKSGFSLPASGRVSYSEWHHKILAQSLPIWRATADNQYDKIMLPYFHKEWVSYGISIPDGLKDSALEDSLAKRYKIQPTSAQPFKLPLPTENEWRIIEKGLSRLPFVNIQELMDAVKKQPECFRGITILGLWLETQIRHEQN